MLQVFIPDQTTWAELFLALKARHVPVMLSVAVPTDLLKTTVMPVGTGRKRNGGTTMRGNGNIDYAREILGVIQAHPAWTATQIRQFLPDVPPAIVAKTLTRLAESGTIKGTGKRRWRRYRVAANRATA